MNPRFASLWYNHAVVLTRLGSVDSALVAFDQVLALEPDRLHARNDRGALRFRKGDLEGAVADFSRVIELDPRSWNAYSNRALAYSRMGEHAKAEEDQRRADLLQPDRRAPK
jgi:Flp pilus assembly protein TadD